MHQIEQAGGKALGIPGDVSDRAAVEHVVAETDRTFGRIDVLVNNAGSGFPGAFAEVDPDLWWHILGVNLRSPAYFSRAVLPRMIARGDGRIINIISGS